VFIKEAHKEEGMEVEVERFQISDKNFARFCSKEGHGSRDE